MSHYRTDVHCSHRWLDTSYHGSPSYECDFCGVYEYKKEAKEPCPKAEECLKKEARKKEIDDYWEYCKMRREKEKFDQLHAKFCTKYNNEKSSRSNRNIS